MTKKILLWGAKSKSRIAENMLRRQGREVSFIYDSHVEKPHFETRATFSNKPADLKKFIAASGEFIVCIGGEHGMARHRVSEKLCSLGLAPLSLISPTALVDDTATLGAGFQAMPGANLHCFSKVGDYCILNTNSCVDHECVLGNGVHIMGCAAVAGRVTLGNYVTVGTNATILPDLTIEDGAFIGAGAVVTGNVGKDEVVVGIPAQFLRKNAHKFSLADFD